MSTFQRSITPARHPDIVYDRIDSPLSWRMRFRNGEANQDVSDGEFRVRLTNNKIELGDAEIDMRRATIGRITVTVPLLLMPLLPRYSTWTLEENYLFKAMLVTGRLARR